MDNRIINPNENVEDCELENPLRPRKLSEYIGQDKVKKKLKIFIEAAKLRNDCLDHVLLYGPPGLGKTTLAMVISNEMQVGMEITSGLAIERQKKLTSTLTEFKNGNILFIDEIHKISHQVEEVLYPAMEDFSVDIAIGKGQTFSSYHLPLPKFTLIGATSELGQLSLSLRDRFGLVLRLELYTIEELRKIILRSASILNIDIDDGGALEIAKKSRGTPRFANRLLKRVRDFAQVKFDGKVSAEISKYAFDYLEIK